MTTAFNHGELLPGSPLPDFGSMSKAEAMEWLETHDHSELIRLAMAKAKGAESTVVVNFRAPTSMVKALDELVGDDPEGRSGVIRRALDEHIARHKGEAA